METAANVLRFALYGYGLMTVLYGTYTILTWYKIFFNEFKEAREDIGKSLTIRDVLTFIGLGLIIGSFWPQTVYYWISEKLTMVRSKS